MLYIGICDDDEGVCAELERMLYDYAEQNKIQMDIDIWHRGESLCRFLREKEQISDVLFLDIELLTTNGIEVGRVPLQFHLLSVILYPETTHPKSALSLSEICTDSLLCAKYQYPSEFYFVPHNHKAFFPIQHKRPHRHHKCQYITFSTPFILPEVYNHWHSFSI